MSTISGAWDVTTGALGVQAATTSQADVAELLDRQDKTTKGDLEDVPAPPPALRRRRRHKRDDEEGERRHTNGVTFAPSGRTATEDAPVQGPGTPSPDVFEPTALAAVDVTAGELVEEEVADEPVTEGGVPASDDVAGIQPQGGTPGAKVGSGRRKASAHHAEEEHGVVGDSSFPGLEYLKRLYAPPELVKQYESLERELQSPEYALYSPEEQQDVKDELLRAQMQIEKRENRLNFIFTAVGSVHSMYVGVLASMLTVFVPQKCPPSALVTDPHTCTLNEVFGLIKSDIFERAVFALNLLTLLLVVIAEYMIFNRERFMDRTLSYNPRRPANNLSAIPADGNPSLMQKHPYVAHAVLWQNISTGNIARAAVSMVAVNLVITSVLILGFHYAGSASVIALITNTLLLGSRLLYASVICLAGQNPRQATSLYKVMRVSFNVIDSNFLSSDEYRRNLHRFTWEDVEAEYARMVQAEQGDVQMMKQQAKAVVKILVGRNGRDSMVLSRRMTRRNKTFQDRVMAAVADMDGLAVPGNGVVREVSSGDVGSPVGEGVVEGPQAIVKAPTPEAAGVPDRRSARMRPPPQRPSSRKIVAALAPAPAEGSAPSS